MDYKDKIIDNLINEVQDLKKLLNELSNRIIELERGKNDDKSK